MRRRTPGSGDAQLTSSDLSRDREHTPHPSTRPKGWELRRMQNEQEATQGAALIHQMIAHLGGIEDLARAAAVGDVLVAGSYVIPANGFFARDFPAGFGALTVANQGGGGELRVASQTSQGQAPTQGVGNFVVPPCIMRTVAVRGTQVTVYGNPGQSFDLVVFSRPRPPAIGLTRRGPIDGILVPAGTTVSTTTLLTGNLERLVLVTNVLAGSVTVTINGVTPSGYIYPLLVGTAFNAVVTTPLRVGPALTPSPNAVANDVVPRTVQVVAVAAAANYGIDFEAG